MRSEAVYQPRYPRTLVKEGLSRAATDAGSRSSIVYLISSGKMAMMRCC